MDTKGVVVDVEDALYRSWKARECITYDGWQLRYADGFSRRGNSVYPARASRIAHGEKLEFCRRWYQKRGQDLIVRQTPATEPGLDDVLAEAGFAVEGATDVMIGKLDGRAGSVPVAKAPSAGWWKTTADLWGFDLTSPTGWIAMIDRIDQPAGFACVDGEAAGLAIAAGPWLGLFEIIVAEKRRGVGLGRELTESLLGWGRTAGAELAYLQVLQTNDNAISFYRGLGFEQAYSYWYRRDAST